MRKTLILSSALATVMACAIAAPVQAADAQEKCYGIAKAGQNDCAGNGHACAGQSKLDRSPGDFKVVKAGTCMQMGGMLKPGM
jgi:uncharacterized membrane protein